MTAWLPPLAVVLAEIGYPLFGGPTRAALVVVTVLGGCAASVGHAAATRGVRAELGLVVVGTVVGFAVEALGVYTGLPFGRYAYADALGPRLLGVPLAIPLAWTWMAWPAWLAAGRLVDPAGSRLVKHLRWRRIGLAGFALAAWDVFLDPQMVREGYWRWADPDPSLPGVPGVPVTNYLGWLLAATVLMALLDLAGGAPVRVPGRDGPMLAFYLWTWASAGLAHAALLDLPGSAVWGTLTMGVVAAPLGWRLARHRLRSRVRVG